MLFSIHRIGIAKKGAMLSHNDLLKNLSLYLKHIFTHLLPRQMLQKRPYRAVARQKLIVSNIGKELAEQPANSADTHRAILTKSDNNQSVQLSPYPLNTYNEAIAPIIKTILSHSGLLSPSAVYANIIGYQAIKMKAIVSSQPVLFRNFTPFSTLCPHVFQVKISGKSIKATNTN